MRRILLLLLPLLACIPALAQTACQELVPKIMEASGMNQSLASMPDDLRQMTDSTFEREGAWSVDTKVAAEKLLLHSFDVERMTRNIQGKLMATCDPALYREALEQLQSPLAQKVSDMEARPRLDPNERVRMERFIASFAMQSPRESRMRLIQDLLSTTRMDERFADVSVSVSSQMTEVLKEAPSRMQIEQAKADLQPQVEESLEGAMFYCFRPLTDDELRQYIAIEASKPTERLNEDLSKALRYAAIVEANDLALKLKPLLLAQKARFGGR